VVSVPWSAAGEARAASPEEIAGLVLAATFIVIGATLAWFLYKVADKQPNAMVTVSLSLLTLAALAGAIATGNEALEVVVGTGIGALATSLTSIFRPKVEGDDT
jgi:Na+-transporting NADH:ubiquinone oxidoreductase subunit NqrE